MRHDPLRIDGVPGEPAGQLVVDAAPGHRLAGTPDLLQRGGGAGAGMVAQQELQHHRGRELRRRAVPAVAWSKCWPSRATAWSSTSAPRVRGAPVARAACNACTIRPLVASTSSCRSVQAWVDGGQQPQETVLGKVGAAEERLAGRGQQAGHRPAAVAGHRGGRGHVDRVDVGPLLAIDLDRHEPLVEDRRHLGVLERLVRHHVAPVAGGVADATAAPGRCAGVPRRTPPRTTATSPPGCRHAGPGTGWSRRRGGWPCLLTGYDACPRYASHRSAPAKSPAAPPGSGPGACPARGDLSRAAAGRPSGAHGALAPGRSVVHAELTNRPDGGRRDRPRGCASAGPARRIGGVVCHGRAPHRSRAVREYPY